MVIQSTQTCSVARAVKVKKVTPNVTALSKVYAYLPGTCTATTDASVCSYTSRAFGRPECSAVLGLAFNPGKNFNTRVRLLLDIDAFTGHARFVAEDGHLHWIQHRYGPDWPASIRPTTTIFTSLSAAGVLFMHGSYLFLGDILFNALTRLP